MLRYLLLISLICLVGCSPEMIRVHARMNQGEVASAVFEAQGDRIALIEVALRVLVRGMDTPEVSEQAAQGLRVGEEYSIPFLKRLFRDSEDEQVRALTAEVWAARGAQRMRRYLQERLDHDDPRIRAVAMRALGPRARSASFFEGGLADSDRQVRIATVAALGSKAGERWAQELLAQTARSDADPAVRASALRWLGRGARGDLLLEAAREALFRPDNPDAVKHAAISALGLADDDLSVEPLLVERLHDGSVPLRLAAAEILASWEHPEGLAVLREAMASSDDTLARDAVSAAARVGEPLGEELLVVLGHRSPEVRLEAAKGLLRLDDQDERWRVPALAELSRLAEGPGMNGFQAALALHRAGDESGQLTLRFAAALSDESVGLRRQAAFLCGFHDWALAMAAAATSDEDTRVALGAATSVLRIIQRTGTRPRDE
jgi:HEAT repeat protein